MADPDLDLRGGLVLIYSPCWPFSTLRAEVPLVISSCFTQNKRGGELGPPGPSPRSTAVATLKYEIHCSPAIRFKGGSGW